ncbi:MAG: TonB family protein [Candidatus Cybelea sp.]
MASVVILTLLLAQVSPSPSSSSTRGPCFHDATVIKPVQPDVRDLMGDFLTAPLATKVQIIVAPDGTVKNASVSESSGFMQFDMAVLQAAKISKYRPKVVDCEPVEGAATFWGTWRPGPPL